MLEINWVWVIVLDFIFVVFYLMIYLPNNRLGLINHWSDYLFPYFFSFLLSFGAAWAIKSLGYLDVAAAALIALVIFSVAVIVHIVRKNKNLFYNLQEFVRRLVQMRKEKVLFRIIKQDGISSINDLTRKYII